MFFIRRNLGIIMLVLCILSVAVFAGYIYIDVLSARSDKAPEFASVPELITVSVSDSEDVIKSGIKASDKEDGDVSDSIIVKEIGSFNEDMTRDVVFAAFDSSNHVTEVTSKLKYSDYSSPEFKLTRPLVMTISESGNILSYIGATDVIDGDLSGQIKIETELDTTPGMHPFTVSVKNSAGDISKITFNVIIRTVSGSESAPEIVLDNYLVYLKKGEQFDPKSRIQSVISNCTVEVTEPATGEEGGEPVKTETEQKLTKDDVTVDNGGFNSSVPGTYSIQYTVTNALNNKGIAILTVVVR